MKNLSDVNDFAENFVNKQRVLKETTSIGGFKISQNSVKKNKSSNVIKSNESLGVFPFNPMDDNFFNKDSLNFSTVNYKTNSQNGKFTSGNNFRSSNQSK